MPVSLLSILVMRGANSEIGGFVVPSGSPRYVNGISPTWQPKVFARWVTL